MHACMHCMHAFMHDRPNEEYESKLYTYMDMDEKIAQRPLYGLHLSFADISLFA